MHVETYGTGTKSDTEILAIIKKNFDLRPGSIVKELGLDKPIYAATVRFLPLGCRSFFVCFVLTRVDRSCST